MEMISDCLKTFIGHQYFYIFVHRIVDLLFVVIIDNTRFSQSTRHHWRGAPRDLLLLALSILIVKLTTLAFRNPRGTTFCGASRDLLLLALSILKKKRNSLFFENSSFVSSCA